MRRYLLVFYLLLFVIGMGCIANAQQRKISGKVVSPDGKPISGASVRVMGQSNVIASTDENGNYSIDVPDSSKFLVFTGWGNNPKTMEIKGLQLNVELVSNSSSYLDSIVVVGYQALKKSDMTSATVSVSGKEVQDQAIPSFLQLLQGKAPGVQVTGTSGRPGANAYIRIRGQGSLTASSEPLIVVDGITVSSAAYNMINPNDIEDITILKDAGATAIYGSRGSNGVVVVTTKKGKGNTQVQYTFQYGSNKAQKLKNLELMDAMQKLQYEYDGGYYSGNGILDSMIENRIDAGIFPANSSLTSLTDAQRLELWQLAASRGVGDWRKELIPGGTMKKHEVSISGSDNKFSFRLALNKTDNGGALYGSYWNIMGGRLNVEYKAYDWLRIGTNIGISSSSENSIRELFNGQAADASAYLLNAYEPFYGSDGRINHTSLGQNAMETTDKNPNKLNRVSGFGTMYAQANFFKHLTLKSQVGINYNTLNQEYYLMPGSYLAETLGYNQKRDNGNRDYLYVFTNTANWNQNINGVHSISAMVGMEYTKDKFYSFSLTARGFPTPDVNTLENGGTPTQATTSRSDWSLISYFANVGYTYDKRFMIGLSGRSDGSSRFGKNNLFAQFGAIQAGWNIKEESFLKDNNLISQLKPRASYGTSGNNSGIGNYQALGTYALNVSYNGLPASSPSTLANPNLTWEKAKETNIGLDFGLLDNRISGSFDWYNRKTTSLLYSVNVSATTGFSSYTGNVGSMSNKGIDLLLSGDIIRTSDLTWNVTATYSHVKNRITSLYSDNTPAPNTGNLAFLKIGEPANVFKMVRWAGVDDQTGKNMYYNIDGTTTDTYSASQAVILHGKSPLPTYYGSLTTSLTYKGFNLTAQFYYSGGNYIMNYVYQTGASDGESIANNQFTTALDYWKKPGDKVNFANLNDPTQNATYDVDKWLEKGNYLSLRNVMLAYSFDNSIIRRLKVLKGLRVFLQGSNLFLWTKYHGLPEAGEANGESTSVVAGTYSLYSYPQYRSLTFGVNVNF